jgi:hypothetical protein
MSQTRVSLTIAVTVAVVLGGLWAGRLVHAAQHDVAVPVGSWSIQVLPDPGSPIPPSLNFAAFTRDGLVINANMTGSAAVGGWEQVGARTYATAFSGFEVIDGQPVRYVVRATLELARDHTTLAGPFLTELYTPEGTLIASVTGAVQGQRMHVEPLP